MTTTNIIAKYNQNLTILKKRREQASTHTIGIVDALIKVVEEFLKDLYYIHEQMPAINPIDKGHYNEAPQGLKIISLEEFQRGMFHYCLYESDSKQVRRNGNTFDLRLFDVPNFDNNKLGYAIMHDWYDQVAGRNREIAITRFCRYGLEEEWESFENRFRAQFAGDNS